MIRVIRVIRVSRVVSGLVQTWPKKPCSDFLGLTIAVVCTARFSPTNKPITHTYAHQQTCHANENKRRACVCEDR